MTGSLHGRSLRRCFLIFVNVKTTSDKCYINKKMTFHSFEAGVIYMSKVVFDRCHVNVKVTLDRCYINKNDN